MILFNKTKNYTMRKFNWIVLGLFLVLLFTLKNVNAISISIGGTISTNTIWNTDTVKVTADIIIDPEATLTIVAGTFVQMQDNYRITVYGGIIANGTALDKIAFTSLDSNSTWKGINVKINNSQVDYSNINVKFNHCIFTYSDKSNEDYIYGDGGAISLNNRSNIEITNCYFSNNKATNGGAIKINGSFQVKIINNVIVNNTCTTSGGGISISTSNALIINNTIANNSSLSKGGIFANGFSGRIVNCIIYGNTSNNTPNKQIYVEPFVNESVQYCNIENGWYYSLKTIETAPNFVNPTIGAGISYDGLSADYSLTQNSSLFNKGNTNAIDSLGIIEDINGDFRYTDFKVDIGAYEQNDLTKVCGTINTDTVWSGNVIVNCDITVNNGTTLIIKPNTNVFFIGPYSINIKGRLLAQGKADSIITITAWNKNEGWKGIRFNNVSVTNDSSKIEYCSISNKRELIDTLYNYGAIIVNNMSKLLIRNNIFSNNYSFKGAAISLVNSNAPIIGNLIINNQSTSFGGGVYIKGSNLSYQPNIISNTIAHNRCINETKGAGVYVDALASPIFKNNIIYTNEDSIGNQGSEDNVFPITGLDVSYCCIQGGYLGISNISVNPIFKNASKIIGIGVDLNTVDFSLHKNSSCFDAGTTSIIGLNLDVLDISNSSRIQNLRIDIGCFEGLSIRDVCGTIENNTLWDESIININCDINVLKDVKLSISPGTKVQFNGYYKIYCEGLFFAIGAEDDTIEFIPLDTTIGWKGIEIKGDYYSAADSNIISYCSFKYAKRSAAHDYIFMGGAISIYRRNNTNINNCLFYRNVHTETSYGSSIASAIGIKYCLEDNMVKITNNTFKKNYGYNGVVSILNSNVDFSNNNISDNSVSINSVLHSSNSSGIISNNTITNNSGKNGSINVSYASTNKSLTISNNLVYNNNARSGGGMYFIDSKVFVYNNTIVNNYCQNAYSGGGVFLSYNSDVNFKSNIIYGNKTILDSSNQICINSESTDPKFYNNNIEGGLLKFTGTGTGIYYSGVFTNNYSVNPSFVGPSLGAGKSFYCDTSNWALLQGSPLINAGYENSSDLGIPEKDINNNVRFFNGRIDIGALENQDPIIAPCNISEDTKWDADTIRINCDVTISNTKTLTITPGTNVVFMGYYEIQVDGNIIAKGEANNRINFTMKDTTGFADSTSTTGGWNGINFSSVISLINDSSIFEYCTFSYAKAISNYYKNKFGGAMNIYNSPMISINNCIFSNNYSQSSGGALYIESSNIKFTNNLLCNNQSSCTAGGIYMDDCIIDFNNNTIVNNKAYHSAGALDIRSCDLNIKNSIFWGNKLWRAYSNIHNQISFFSSNNSILNNNNIQYGVHGVSGGFHGTILNTIDIDPQFVNPTPKAGAKHYGIGAIWNLKSSSPLLNKGLTSVSSSSFDIAGNPRLVGDTIDIGAYEIQLTDRFIDVQPINMDICTESSVNIVTHVNASVNYQWQKNDTNIAGATSRILNIQSMTLADSGFYHCVMSNQYGIVRTDTIKITPLLSPRIIASPESLSKCLGSSVTFNAEVDGSFPITYEWYNINGSLGSGASKTSFKIGEDSLINNPNDYPTPFGNCYWGNKEQYLILASELTDQGLVAGAIPSLAFYVTAKNSCPTLSNFILKIGSTNDLVLTSTWISSLSTVYSVASYQINSGWNTFGFTTPYIWDGVSNIVIEVSTNNSSYIGNGNASVNYSTTSFSSSHYLYKDNVTDIANNTLAGHVSMKRPNIKLSGGVSISSGTTSYSINSISANSASNYYLIATNTCGSDQSDGAILGINYSPVLTPISASNSICEDASYTFSTTISQGTSPMTYQWYKDEKSVLSAASLSYNITTADTSNDGIYYCKATNICGSDSTNQSIMIVNEKPKVTAQSSSKTVCGNQSTTMYVTASGTAPLTYQWYKEANEISGATNNTYTLSSITSNDAASYYCKVSNGCTTVPVSSTAIELTVNTAPTITTQTSGINVCETNSATFSITATGTAPITYQWYDANSSISSATNNSYSINSVNASDIGNYYCVATNSCGNANSNPISLSVKSAPSINLQPASATSCIGSSAQFYTTASGTSPFTYQWCNSDGSINGAINSNYIINQISGSNSGNYYAEITNSCGTAITNNATLTVNSPVSISTQPNNITICDNSTATMSITVTGTTPITYQWYVDGDTVVSGTNSIFSINNADTANEGNYYVRASNLCNYVQSNSVSLTINETPSITSQPSNTTVCSGSSSLFSVGADGASPLTYQWYYVNSEIIGANNTNYIIGQSSPNDAGTYYVIISNSCGNITSNNSILTVIEPIAITTQPTDIVICENSTVNFNISATGSNPLAYQWYNDTGLVVGANANSYIIPSTSILNAGSYYCTISNNCGSVTSSVKTLTVNTAPVIIAQSSDDTICEGISEVFQVGVTGTNPISYQWYKNNTLIPTALSSYMSIPSVDTNDIGVYHSVATNLCGNIQSNDINLHVNQLAKIISQSGDSSRCENESMTFQIDVTGTSPINYQWYKGSNPIIGSILSTHHIDSIEMNDAGLYHLDVSNICNSTSSNYKQLTVHSNPVVELGDDTTFCDGGMAQLIAGYGYLCQWNNGSLNNQINVTSTGSYFVNVTDQYGCSGISDSINVNVVLPYSNQELCMVGIDTATNKNVLVWEKTAGQGISYFNLYKESAVSNVWNLLGNISYDSLSVFIDNSSTPNVKPERYAISVVDSCGNESSRSSSHRTMHLTVNQGQTANDWNLIWNAYEGFTPSTYRIYRADSTMNFIKIDSIAGSIYRLWSSKWTIILYG